MELIRGLANLRPRHHGSVITIGSFDGLHRGHQAVIGRLRALAERHGEPSVVMTFEPTPKEFFEPRQAPPRLMRLREKAEALAALGVDRFVVIHFNAAVSRMPAAEFANGVLHHGLGARHIVIGEGFRFGSRRAGTAAMLREIGAAQGFTVEEVAPVEFDGERVSSTAIRAALARNDFSGAARLLGRPYRISGRVIEGQRLGRTLGFATANLRLYRRASPVAGIFAVRVHGVASGVVEGVASLGTRPTVNGIEPLLETHVFDYAGDLYGRYIGVEFVAKIRDEEKFPDLDSLVVQMHDDARKARSLLAESRLN
ncbi:MAG: bifunctional riboflavin kinase/FAD synthetase [Steroidobacteraceae bacterium]